MDHESSNIEEFIKSLQDYTPPIPENLINHLLAESGMNTTDPRVSLAVNVATQKFINNVLNRCRDAAKERILNDTNQSTKRKMDLQVSDVKQAISHYFPIHRPEFLVSLPEDEE